MDKREAMDIINSDDFTEVLFNGTSVWLENAKDDEALVRIIDTDEVVSIPYAQLENNHRELK